MHAHLFIFMQYNTAIMKNYFTKQSFKNAFKILKNTITGFAEDKGMKLSASLSYYTVFSMAPLLLLLISLAGAFFWEGGNRRAGIF